MPQSNATTRFFDFNAHRAAQEANTKIQLVIKLKEHHLLSDDQMDQFKHHAVNYYRKHRFRESQDEGRQLQLEKEYNGVTLHYFIQATIEWMKNCLPIGRCIQIYEDVISVIPCDRDEPARTEPTKREKPETPFSVSRAEPRFTKSNAELIDALASATNMKPGTAINIRGSIVVADSISGGNNFTSGILTSWTGLVSGGRLGRDHMLNDVPNHYVRDRLMDYIDTQLQEDKLERALLAVFTDLNSDEIKQYSVLVKQWIEKCEPKTCEELIALVAGNKVIKTDTERGRVLDLGQALEDVYQDVDLTPKPGFAERTYSDPGPIIYSVVDPGQKKPTPQEWYLDPGTDIDRDCDQIRAMIAIFAFSKEWTVDQFRRALGNRIERKDLTHFLSDYGPKEGNNTIYQLAWEFFKRRELLGFSLVVDISADTSDNRDILQERDTNTRKRPSTEANGGNTKEKRTRRS
ncbi:uncharacterized protein F4807DRAFT_433930 [Annulohypoxylon truncatum]|uniref:uncharacterized protein n=1 Tax=Annulohypoxylon truncatum TaxID=327061 RepID=UPI002007D3D0|nr:uncharacterized protein F4807DRAFT_433930 [Annulohypoxylon truncatum]KAI1207608.1 hypothetical protein F4807DRAFT_433930 [Annulohypoxylon truncatum]